MMTSKVLPSIDYFNKVYLAYQEAAGQSNKNPHFLFEVSEYCINLEFANQNIFPLLTPALEHNQVSGSPKPDLTICIWDTKSSKTSLPVLSWENLEFNIRRGVSLYHDQRITISYEIEPKILSMLDSERNLAIYWFQNAETITPSIQAIPMRPIIHWRMRAKGLQLVHAAVVGTKDACAIITGKGGSGKSTTAMACVSKKMFYLSDDMVLLGTNPTPQAFSLYNSAKIDSESYRILQSITPSYRNNYLQDTEKKIYFIQDIFPTQITTNLPIKAILIPKITASTDTKISPASASEAIKTLAPSTIIIIIGMGSLDLRMMSTLVQQVPCYYLQLGTELDQIPEVIKSVLV